MGDDAPAEPQTPNPGKGVLAVLSLGVFAGLILMGGAIGLLIGSDGSSPPLATAPTTPEVVTALTTTITPTTTIAVTTTIVSAPASDAAQGPDVTGDDESSIARVEVLGVTERGLPLGTQSSEAPSAVPTTPTLEEDLVDTEFIELPKAVYDRFTLEPNERLIVNVAANDKIGGRLESVVATGLGSLPAGFTLDDDGLLSGSTGECGNWRLQYALVSTNPAIGTSWIDITVDGCA